MKNKISVLLALAALLAAFGVPARAADISTFSFNSGMNCRGSWRLPDTGQTGCYDTAGNSIGCPAPGAALAQDGSYAPVLTQPAYTVFNPVGISSVTLDNVSGLMWITNPRADAAMGGLYNWTAAVAACEAKDYAGYSDWRLPNVRELMSISDYSKDTGPSINAAAFPGARTSAYWSSTTYLQNATLAWRVSFLDGGVNVDLKTLGSYVRCVRGGL
jgi:hypothetical protein